MTTTAHPAHLTTSVVTPDARADVDAFPRIVSAGSRGLPARLLAVDLVAAVVTTAAVLVTTGAWTPVVAAAIPVLWLILVASSGGYREVPGEGRRVRARALIRAGGGLGLALWIAAAVISGELAESTAGTARAGLALAFLVPAASMTLRRLLSAAPSSQISRVVIAGDHRGVEDLLHELRRAAEAGTTTFVPVAVCVSAEDDDRPRMLGPLPVWRGLEFVADAVLAHSPDAVVVSPCTELDPQALRRLSIRLQETGTDMVVTSGVRDVAGGRLDLTSAGGLTALHLRPAPTSGPTRLLKDVVDRLGAAVLLMLLAPVFAVLVVAIRLDSAGPALFRQVRVGRHGEHFTLWKLRTMHCGAEDALAQLGEANEHDATGLLFKIRRDPRLTRIGTVLRRYSLDELPQLVNVVRGEMSMIGPRPALPAEVQGLQR